MDQFPGNANKANQQNKQKTPVEKQIEKVVTGEVIKRKKPLGSRIKDTFFGGDLKNVARYVAGDVLLPALKNMLVDTIEQGAKRAIYGDSVVRRRAPDTNRPRVSYNSPIDRTYSRQQGVMLPHQPPHYPPTRNRQNVGDIILSSRNEAEMVVERMKDILDQYDTVSIADLYELLGLPSSHVDHVWGWADLGYVNVRQIREGYVIDLPPAHPL